MMKRSLFTLILACFGLITMALAQTNPSASITVSGEVTAPLTINDTYLQQFAQTTITRKDHDGKEHTYSGVILADILKKAGATVGKDLKGKNLTKYLLVSARDHYQVVFALAELDDIFTDRKIILANKVDGKPLSPDEGPFRVIVQDEKKPARCIRQVTAFQVLSAK